MAYQEFAYFYDEFNGAADYDALFAYVTGELKAHGIQDGIVADFGCGTGELTCTGPFVPRFPLSIPITTSVRRKTLKRPSQKPRFLWKKTAFLCLT